MMVDFVHAHVHCCLRSKVGFVVVQCSGLGSAGVKAGRGHRVGSIVEFIRHAYVDSSTAYIFSIAEIALKMLSRY